jgi:hypothetical protein
MDLFRIQTLQCRLANKPNTVQRTAKQGAKVNTAYQNSLEGFQNANAIAQLTELLLYAWQNQVSQLLLGLCFFP